MSRPAMRPTAKEEKVFSAETNQRSLNTQHGLMGEEELRVYSFGERKTRTRL